MKRILLTITGTVAGIVALLSFKTHTPAIGPAGRLPSAGLPVAGLNPTAPTSAAGSPPAAGPSVATTPSAPASVAGPTAVRSANGDAVQTPYGVVQVRVTERGKKIINVSFLQLTAYDSRSQFINQSAAPILMQETLTAQSAQIDGVSGASYTSAGYDQSLQSALDKL